MDNAFDPYHKWLGIPPEEQPPNHYRLLGLRLFENDDDVIDNAAEGRILLLRTRQGGPNVDKCQQLLNEIATARRCLLDHDSRRRYNAGLRDEGIEQSLPGPVPADVTWETALPFHPPEPHDARKEKASVPSSRTTVDVPRVPMSLEAATEGVPAKNIAKRILATVRDVGVQNMYEEPYRGYEGLNQHLRDRLVGTKRSYPRGAYKGICDLVFAADALTYWIEVKLIWHYLDQTRWKKPNGNINKCYFWNKPEGREPSALFDVKRKLPTLVGSPEVDRIGFLMVCFDSTAVPLDESWIIDFEKRGELAMWDKAELPMWTNPNNSNCRIRAFYWERYSAAS